MACALLVCATILDLSHFKSAHGYAGLLFLMSFLMGLAALCFDD